MGGGEHVTAHFISRIYGAAFWSWAQPYDSP